MEQTLSWEKTHLELRHALSHLDTDLDHVEHLAREHPRKHEVVRALLGVQANAKEGGVVLFGPELEGGGVLERVDVVLLGERDRVGSLEHGLRRRSIAKQGLLGQCLNGKEVQLDQTYELLEGDADPLSSLVAVDKDGRLGVLDHLGLSLLERSLDSGRLGLAGREARETIQLCDL